MCCKPSLGQGLIQATEATEYFPGYTVHYTVAHCSAHPRWHCIPANKNLDSPLDAKFK